MKSYVMARTPEHQVVLDFRALRTPMVEWRGTAQELHDLIMRASLEAVGEADAALEPSR